jgi:ATP-dependent DNA helicase RecG
VGVVGGKMDREGRQLEYKVSFGNMKSIYRSIVAFSNDIGGKIVVGVEDKSLAVVGLSEQDIDFGLEEMPKAIFDAISPVCIPLVTTETIAGKCCLVIQVFAGQKKPYYIKAEGLPKGVYVRIGANNKKATEDILEDLLRDSQRRFWDEELTNLTLDQLDVQQIEGLYGKGWDDTLLRADGVLGLTPRGEEKVSQSGVIYFHPNPAILLPQAEVLYTQFDGENMARAIRTIDFSGPLPQLVLRIMAELKPHVVLREEVRGAKREKVKWAIPEIVLREVLLNALLHRKYSIMGAIKIAVFSNRIEVFSPGNFPGPIDLHQLGNGVSYTRNPRLRQLARKAGLVEKRGMGFRIMLDECDRNGNASPKVEEGGDYVKVTLYFDQQLDRTLELPDAYAELQEYRNKGLALQPKQVSEIMGVSINTARSRLVELVGMDIMKRKGAGRSLTYHWVNESDE